MSVDGNRGEILLAIARAAIARELGREMRSPEDAPWLYEPGATFVTLRQGTDLRGCIGSLEPRLPLVRDVQANAVSAAFRDPRFSPLRVDEFERTRVEVSLLSPLQPITAENEQHALAQLEPGVHGVTFEYGYHRSTFLPQVWEDLPDIHEFMGHLRQKAGLPPDFWDPEVKLARYTVSKWAEPDR
jgi:AmmeMemoRadiSam system protein A